MPAHNSTEATAEVDVEYHDWPRTRLSGIRISPHDLNYHVVDEESVQHTWETSENESDKVLIALAREQYRTAAGLIADARLRDPASMWLQILEADVVAVSHNADRAIQVLKQVLDRVRGVPLEEAMVRQHLGKAYFSARNYRLAAVQFDAALNLRVEHRAGAELLYSTTVALGRSRELLERQGQ